MTRGTLIILVLAVVSGTAGFLAARHLAEPDAPLDRPGPQQAADVLGSEFPPLSGVDLAGATRQVSDYRGKALLINFWATWCAPCRREMPDLMALDESLDPDQARVLGVALDFPDDVRAYVDELGIAYPILVPDELDGTRILRRLGNANGLLPFSVIVDASGRVRELHLGELTREEAAEALSSAL